METFSTPEAIERKLLERDKLPPPKKRPGFFRLYQKRWREAWKGLGPYERLVLLSLWLYAGSRTDCWPSVRRVAAELEVTKKSVQHSIHSLEQKGFLRIEKAVGKWGKRNHYFLLK